MSLKKYLLGSIILLMSFLTACSGGQSLDEKIIDKIKKFETSEYDLYYFNIDYDTYLAQVDEIVSDAYLDAEKDRVIFGYLGANYTSKELKGMPHDEWSKHKDTMLGIFDFLKGQKVTIHFSKPFDSEQENQLFVYTSQMKEVNDESFAKTNKKYTMNMIEGQWLVTSVELDRFVYGSERTEDETQSGLAKMKYQMHDDHPIEYLKDTVVLQGVAED